MKSTRKKNTARNSGPTILGYKKGLKGILYYEQWVNGSNPVGEVVASEQKSEDVLRTPKKRFPTREGTQQWNFQKMHGAFKMAKIQPCCL